VLHCQTGISLGGTIKVDLVEALEGGYQQWELDREESVQGFGIVWFKGSAKCQVTRMDISRGSKRMSSWVQDWA